MGGNFCGVMKSMADSARRDGNGRKIDSICSIQPWLKGHLEDPTDELDKSKVKVVLNAISTGEKVGEIVLGEQIHFTGKELAMGEGDGITWEIPEDGHHGSVDPTKTTSDATRITLAADALDGLIPGPALDGRTIVFTVRGNFSSAKISAKLKYVAPPPPTGPRIEKVTDRADTEGRIVANEADYRIYVADMPDIATSDLKVTWTRPGGEKIVTAKSDIDWMSHDDYLVPSMPENAQAGETVSVTVTYGTTETAPVSVTVA